MGCGASTYDDVAEPVAESNVKLEALKTDMMERAKDEDFDENDEERLEVLQSRIDEMAHLDESQIDDRMEGAYVDDNSTLGDNDKNLSKRMGHRRWR
mmetsp:Transcript_30643/g.63241  ORF Transcript_30643/g.63241 Transcript_30643/m.63241 type:complete len:97 (+) Transcript_30643:58-348(+)